MRRKNDLNWFVLEKETKYAMQTSFNCLFVGVLFCCCLIVLLTAFVLLGECVCFVYLAVWRNSGWSNTLQYKLRILTQANLIPGQGQLSWTLFSVNIVSRRIESKSKANQGRVNCFRARTHTQTHRSLFTGSHTHTIITITSPFGHNNWNWCVSNVFCWTD